MKSSVVRESVTTQDIVEQDNIPGRAIDLVHLAQQSLGDRSLEIELLTLFERQAGLIMARLRQEGDGNGSWRLDLSHTLKGSARAVGAMRVAAAAQYYEDLTRGEACATVQAAAVDKLDGYVVEAQSVIRELVSAT